MNGIEWLPRCARPQSYQSRPNRQWCARPAGCVRAPSPTIAVSPSRARAAPEPADRAHNTALPSAASTAHSCRSRPVGNVVVGAPEPRRHAIGSRPTLQKKEVRPAVLGPEQAAHPDGYPADPAAARRVSRDTGESACRYKYRAWFDPHNIRKDKDSLRQST